MFLSLPPVIRSSWRGSWRPKSPMCPQEPQPCGFCHFWNPKSWSRGWIWKQNRLVLAFVSHLVSDVLQFRQQRQEPWGEAMGSVRAWCSARCPGWAVLLDTPCSPCSTQGMVQPRVVLRLVPLLTAPSWAHPSLQQRGRIWVMSTEVAPAKCCALCQELEVHSTSQNEAFRCVWLLFVHFPSMQPHTT